MRFHPESLFQCIGEYTLDHAIISHGLRDFERSIEILEVLRAITSQIGGTVKRQINIHS